MPSKKRQFGDIGEVEAEKFVKNKGFKILSRNYRVRNIGEIDLIASKSDKIVFFEVKTRDVKHETNFPIELSITKKKLHILKKMCQIYLIANRLPIDQKWQVDGIFIEISSDNQCKIKHLENILWERYY